MATFKEVLQGVWLFYLHRLALKGLLCSPLPRAAGASWKHTEGRHMEGSLAT